MLRKLRKNYRRLVAFMLTAAMTFTNIGMNLNVAFAAGEEQEALFLVDGTDLREAIDSAVDSGETFRFSSLELKAKTKSLKTSYEKLIGGKDGKVYQLDVDVDGRHAPADTDVEIFYNAGTEEVIFLFINESDMVVSFRANVDGYETGRVVINPNTANVDDAEASYTEDYSNTTMLDDMSHTLGAEVLNPTTSAADASEGTEADAGESSEAVEGTEGEETTAADETSAEESSGAGEEVEPTSAVDPEETTAEETTEAVVPEETTADEPAGTIAPEETTADEPAGTVVPEETTAGEPAEDADPEETTEAAGPGVTTEEETEAEAGRDAAEAEETEAEESEVQPEAAEPEAEDADGEEVSTEGTAVASISIRKLQQVASGVQISEDEISAPEDEPEELVTEAEADQIEADETNTDEEETGNEAGEVDETDADQADGTEASETEENKADETGESDETDETDETGETDETRADEAEESSAATEGSAADETSESEDENGAADESSAADIIIEESTAANETDDATTPAEEETPAETEAPEGGSASDAPDFSEGQELEDDINGTLRQEGTLDGKAYNTVTIWGSANARAYRVAVEDLALRKADQEMTCPEFSPAPVDMNGVTITVHAEEGIIPEGTELEVTEVTSQLKDAILEKLGDEGDAMVQEVIAYDINLVRNGEKLDNSWSENGRVDVTFSGSRIRSLTEEADKVSFYAIDDNTAAPLSAETAADVTASDLKLEAVGETEV